MTPDLASVLRTLYVSENLTLAEIAARLNMSSESVRRALIEAGVPRRPRGSPAGKHLPNGGETVDGDGYHLRLVPGHPHTRSGYVLLHRLVMEAHWGRYLEPAEVVAHRDHDRSNNSLANLQLFASMTEYAKETLKGNSHSKGDVGNPKRRVRRPRSAEQMLIELSRLHDVLGRDVRRSDLRPPNPSHRAIARKFGTWQAGVAAALDRYNMTSSARSTEAVPPAVGEPAPELLDAA